MTAPFTTVEGPRAVAVLEGALREVGQAVSYLKAEIGPVEWTRPGDAPAAVVDGMWLSCQDLIDDPAWLARVVAGTGKAIGTDDQVVAASIFVQGYAYRLLALGVASLTVSGVVPGNHPAAMAVGLGRGRVSKVAYIDPTVFVVPEGRSPAEMLSDSSVADQALTLLIDQAIDSHVRPVIASIRQQLRIGERLLWGNVAASASTAFRTMEGSLGAWVELLGHRFFALAPAELQGLGSFLLLQTPEGRGWFWERTNCCLFYQIDGHAKCADCSLTPAAERRAAYEESLEG